MGPCAITIPLVFLRGGQRETHKKAEKSIQGEKTLYSLALKVEEGALEPRPAKNAAVGTRKTKNYSLAPQMGSGL